LSWSVVATEAPVSRISPAGPIEMNEVVFGYFVWSCSQSV
jgi:hypothetical protein